MEIHQIPYICVAEAGSFTTVATRVHVVQPSLFQHIIKLKDELGAEPFHRFYRKILLTGLGQTFFFGTQNALRAISSAKAEVHEMTASETLKIGAIPTVQSRRTRFGLAICSSETTRDGHGICAAVLIGNR